MFNGKFNRKSTFAKLEALRRDGSETLAELKKEVEAARKAYEAWDAPRRRYEELARRVQNESASNYLLEGQLEMELRQDAEPIVRRALDWLDNELQIGRLGIHTADDKRDAGPYIEAVQKALRDIDELMVSGETDLAAALDKIMAAVPKSWTRYDRKRDAQREEITRALQETIEVSI